MRDRMCSIVVHQEEPAVQRMLELTQSLDPQFGRLIRLISRRIPDQRNADIDQATFAVQVER